MVTRVNGDFAGGSSMPPAGLQYSHGIPAPQSQASARWLSPRQGRSGWFSQTQPVSSQTSHRIAIDMSDVGFLGRHGSWQLPEPPITQSNRQGHWRIPHLRHGILFATPRGFSLRHIALYPNARFKFWELKSKAWGAFVTTKEKLELTGLAFGITASVLSTALLAFTLTQAIAWLLKRAALRGAKAL
jgi:hypothetical protein